MSSKTKAKPTAETNNEEEEIPTNLFKLQKQRYESAKSIPSKKSFTQQFQHHIYVGHFV
jgi:hypothetical protein